MNLININPSANDFIIIIVITAASGKINTQHRYHRNGQHIPKKVFLFHFLLIILCL